VPSGGWSRPSNGNDNNDYEGEEDTQGGDKGTRKENGTKDGNGKGEGKARRKGRGRGRETVKGNVLLNTPQEQMISLVPLHCCCRK
jgi:hypothetical protein